MPSFGKTNSMPSSGASPLRPPRPNSRVASLSAMETWIVCPSRVMARRRAGGCAAVAAASVRGDVLICAYTRAPISKKATASMPKSMDLFFIKRLFAADIRAVSCLGVVRAVSPQDLRAEQEHDCDYDERNEPISRDNQVIPDGFLFPEHHAEHCRRGKAGPAPYAEIYRGRHIVHAPCDAEVIHDVRDEHRRE